MKFASMWHMDVELLLRAGSLLVRAGRQVCLHPLLPAADAAESPNEWAYNELRFLYAACIH